MAIATVRIAPVDRWCEGARERGGEELRSKGVVKIDTASMWTRQNDAEGEFRNWKLVGEDLDWLRLNWGADSLCEHVLEMD